MYIPKNHVDFKYVYLQVLLWKTKFKKISRHHSCSNVWNSEDSNAFLVKLLDICVKFLL
jgi:hypothetical protein